MMLGTSVSGLVMAYQHQAAAVLKETNGDMWLIIRHLLSEMQMRGAFDAEDLKKLESSFSDALDVFAGKQTRAKALVRSRASYATMVANQKSSDVARALAEVCLLALNEPQPAAPTHEAIVLAATTTVHGTKESLVWGCVGVLLGVAAGGGFGGALLGAAIGAIVGSCGDSGTTITNTGGGGSPT